MASSCGGTNSRSHWIECSRMRESTSRNQPNGCNNSLNIESASTMRFSAQLLITLLFGVSRVTPQTQGFPEVTVQTFDPTQVNPNAERFQLADYDAKRSQVLFYPEGNFPGISLNGVSTSLR